ncbi:MAG: 3-hydroxyacyl-CoA dehydrogenase NAD-binding domain-containing protein, partial [Acidimicrobiales bacterium]
MSNSTVGIVGSGIMGSGITECAALNGLEVILVSREQSTADAAVAGIEKSLNRQVDKGKIGDTERNDALSRVKAESDIGSLAECDLVIEAVIENLADKKRIFHIVDRECKNHTIIATNTSTFPVVELAMETGRPEKVCGVHFFNPVSAMPLVEIVRPITASE